MLVLIWFNLRLCVLSVMNMVLRESCMVLNGIEVSVSVVMCGLVVISVSCVWRLSCGGGMNVLV